MRQNQIVNPYHLPDDGFFDVGISIDGCLNQHNSAYLADARNSDDLGQILGHTSGAVYFDGLFGRANGVYLATPTLVPEPSVLANNNRPTFIINVIAIRFPAESKLTKFLQGMESDMPQTAIMDRSPHGPPCQRHRPEQTLLYQIVEQYYPEFRHVMVAQGKSLPIHIQQEFSEYLKCGRLER